MSIKWSLGTNELKSQFFQKFLEHRHYITKLTVPVFSLENVEIKIKLVIEGGGLS